MKLFWTSALCSTLEKRFPPNTALWSLTQAHTHIQITLYHTHTQSRSHTHTHTHNLSLSLSLITHTYSVTQFLLQSVSELSEMRSSWWVVKTMTHDSPDS